MKKVWIVMLLLVGSLLVSCRSSTSYQLLNPAEQVSEISVVMVSFDANGDMQQDELKKIEEIDSFFADFRTVNCYVWYGDPIGVTQEGVEDIVFKITYQNGEYELINWCGQSLHTSEGGFSYYAGICVFDETEFEALIETYS